MNWEDAVFYAVLKQCGENQSLKFTRQELIKNHLNTIVESTGSIGGTPGETLSYILQRLRDKEIIRFIDYYGFYELIRLKKI